MSDEDEVRNLAVSEAQFEIINDLLERERGWKFVGPVPATISEADIGEDASFYFLQMPEIGRG